MDGVNNLNNNNVQENQFESMCNSVFKPACSPEVCNIPKVPYHQNLVIGRGKIRKYTDNKTYEELIFKLNIYRELEEVYRLFFIISYILKNYIILFFSTHIILKILRFIINKDNRKVILNMKKELKYFNIENSYGGNKNWFYDPMMKLGGCAAVVACDLCIYLKILRGIKNLYPFNIYFLQKKDYIKFSKTMKPYLHPRLKGIDTLQLYIDGFKSYLHDINYEEINIEPFSGENSVYDGEKIIVNQIEKEIPIPFLLLKHKNKKLYKFVWHWFLIVGYEKTEDDLLVKVATYGKYKWISFKDLWNTGYDKKGGMLIINLDKV